VFDIGALEFVVLAIAALFIFGPDRLPDMARQAARGVRQLRNMAANARRELSRELGPEFEDLDIRDLNPRSFVRKHVLDGLDEDDLRVDRDLDIRDDLRVDDKPKRKSGNGTVNGVDTAKDTSTSTDTGTSRASETADDADPTSATRSDATLDDLPPDLDPADLEGADPGLVGGSASDDGRDGAESETASDSRAVSVATVTIPPFDSEAT
jgi:sec-independent protein translocase protein TatB